MCNQNLRVLLVDDNPGIISSLGCALGSSKVCVSAYNDPNKAIGEYEVGNYDFHVIDVWMPKMSGFELARAIWKLDQTAQICFLSAFEIDMSLAESLFGKVNSSCLIRKPITAEEIARHLWSHFGVAHT